jgi:hypothetical protein
MDLALVEIIHNGSGPALGRAAVFPGIQISRVDHHQGPGRHSYIIHGFSPLFSHRGIM